ncbi:hypothetical protein D3C81_1582590 [compost metagenome]
MGNVQDRLGEFFEPGNSQLIEHDRQDQRCGKRDDQIQQIKHQRIAQRLEEVVVLEHFPEYIQAYPFTAANPLKKIKVLKCNLHPVHRAIFKNNEVHDRQQQQSIQLPMSA